MLTSGDVAAHDAQAARAMAPLHTACVASIARDVFVLQQRVRVHETAQETALVRAERDARRREYDARVA